MGIKIFYPYIRKYGSQYTAKIRELLIRHARNTIPFTTEIRVVGGGGGGGLQIRILLEYGIPYIFKQTLFNLSYCVPVWS